MGRWVMRTSAEIIDTGQDRPALPIKAVVFDCYGTLLRVVDQRRPYERLARLAGGRLEPSPITTPLSLADVVARNVPRIAIGPDELQRLEADLEAEVSSIEPIGEALHVLARLRARGLRVAIASNLAPPYAEPIGRLLGGHIDAQVLSFELGAVKPAAVVYLEACRRLGSNPERVLMVGDSRRSDVDGPIAAGMQARHLAPGATLEGLLADLLLA